MKKFLFNEIGSSLVQVMVISGMVSVFGLAVMQTSKNMQSMKHTLIVKDTLEQFEESVTGLMSNKVACSNTISSLVATRSQAGSDKTVSEVFDSASNSAYKLFNKNLPPATNDTVYHGTIRIDEMTLTNYDPAKDSAILQIDLLTSSRGIDDSEMGSTQHFGSLVLGGTKKTLNIPIRLYFNRAVNQGNQASDPFYECYAENVSDDASESPLKKLCDADLGGSFYNGRCIVADYIMDSARCWDGSCSTALAQRRSICHNLGGNFSVDANGVARCTPRMGAIGCVPPEVLKGFNTEGIAICGAP